MPRVTVVGVDVGADDGLDPRRVGEVTVTWF